MTDTIFAVVWSDFGVPLNLRFANEAEAVAKAQDMHANAEFAHIRLGHLRAVRLDADDKLTTLWEPQQAKCAGQIAYEADVAKRPLYHDGTPRKPWTQLGDVEKWSWIRPEKGA